MTRARGCDLHAGEGMLDHSIRDPSPLPYHLSFMVELARRGRLATCTGLPFIFCHYDYSCYNSYILTACLLHLMYNS
jgi:hypothetical protein